MRDQLPALWAHITGWRTIAALFVFALAAVPAAAFDFEDVAREAERLARAPYRKPAAPDPAVRSPVVTQ